MAVVRLTELWRLDAADLVEGYRTRTFTPVEAAEDCLARIEHCQPILNQMTVTDHAGARASAVSSRLRWQSGTPLGLLDGVPVTVKDNLHVAALPTGWGSRLLRGYAPARDETPVARLRGAGAVVLGKTTLPEFAMQGFTSNLVTGTTGNPWDPTLTPGGSSGGAAAAVAAGCGPLALATDGGGSIRRPASHCGLVGFKPSSGLVPRGGGLPEIFLDWEVAGGIGRNLQDVRALLEVLAGLSLAAVAPCHARILYVPRFGGHPIDPEIAAAVRQAAGHFQVLGHAVEEAQQFDLAEPINALWPKLSAAGLAWMIQNAGTFPEFALLSGQAVDTSVCGAAAQAILADGRAAHAAGLFDILIALRHLRHELKAVFARHDFILTPATAALPWPAAQSYPIEIDGCQVGPRGHAVFTAIANAAGLPAVALPCGWVGHLPTGFQLIGKRGADPALLALAQEYEAAYLRDRTSAPEYVDNRERPT